MSPGWTPPPSPLAQRMPAGLAPPRVDDSKKKKKREKACLLDIQFKIDIMTIIFDYFNLGYTFTQNTVYLCCIITF